MQMSVLSKQQSKLWTLATDGRLQFIGCGSSVLYIHSAAGRWRYRAGVLASAIGGTFLPMFDPIYIASRNLRSQNFMPCPPSFEMRDVAIGCDSI